MLVHEKQSLPANVATDGISNGRKLTSLAAIFRIIGNENLPRDDRGKRLQVLEHILRNEPHLPHAQKWYILNRLQDIQYRRAVCELLDRYNCKYLTIPLDRESVIAQPDQMSKIKTAVEINNARNVAINYGKWLAKYVVVLDGDCIFDMSGWSEVVDMMKTEEYQYISIPHVRSAIGTEMLGDKAEPMVAVRNDATLRFDESIPFGEGDKLKFLYQLGHDQTPGSGHCRIDGNKTILVGYVTHLSTGSRHIEDNTVARIEARNISMVNLIKHIEEEQPIRISGHNSFYQSIDSACDFDYTGQYSAIAFDAPDNAHIVEVGSWVGKSICYLATEFKGYGKRVQIDCVDVWGETNDPHLMDEMTKMGGPEAVYDEFCKNIKDAGINHMINPVRMKSVDAAKLYADQSIDVVWIDASHNYQDVLDDMNAWYPKVKIGGMLAGHDFLMSHPASREGVVKAVLEFFSDKPLEVMPSGRTWKSIRYEDNWPTFRKRRWV